MATCLLAISSGMGTCLDPPAGLRFRTWLWLYHTFRSFLGISWTLLGIESSLTHKASMIYQCCFHYGWGLSDQSRQCLRSHGTLGARCTQDHRGLLAYPAQTISRQLSPVDLGISTSVAHQLHQFSAGMTTLSFHCTPEQVVAFQGGALQLDAFLTVSSHASNGLVIRRRSSQMAPFNHLATGLQLPILQSFQLRNPFQQKLPCQRRRKTQVHKSPV